MRISALMPLESMKRAKNCCSQRGFTAFEVMVVLIISIAMLGLGAQYMASYADNLSNQATADHMNLVANAASRYIKDNYAAVLAAAGPLKPATITVSMLKRTGYLATVIAELNPFGQHYQILALKPSTKQLQTLVITNGGEAISEINIRRIAQLLGARGGFISELNKKQAQGSYGGWQIALSAYGIAPRGGYLASALFFDDGAVVHDYLYRSNIAGHPELNRMNTDLDLANHNLNQAAQVNTQRVIANDSITAQGAISAARAQIEGDITSGGWFRSAGDSGWYNQKWQGGWYMSDADWVRSYADKNIYTGGQIHAGTMQTKGRLTSGEYLQIDGIANIGQRCESNGLVARDEKGLILSCQSGIWKKSDSPKGKWQVIPNSGIVPGDGFLRVQVGTKGFVDYRVYIDSQEISNNHWNPSGWSWAVHTQFIPVAAGSHYSFEGDISSISVWWMPG